MTIFLAADHAGFELKEYIKKELTAHGYVVIDKGAHASIFDDDYPPYMKAAAEEVAKTAGSFGLLFGGSGQGEAMEANRLRGVRAAVYYGGSHDILRLSREHNDANILSMGARFIEQKDALGAVLFWLETPFSGDERHKRRIAELDTL